MRNTFIAMMCTVVLVLPVAAQQRVDETRQVAADAVVTFEGVSGTVVVSGWDRAEVRVTGTLGRRIEKLEITGSDQRLDLRVVYPRNCHDCGDADLELKVPAGCRFEAETVSADLELGGVRGEVWLKSVSGRVRVAAGGSLRAKTVSGPLVIRGAGRAVNATTVSGALSADVAVLEDGEFETVSGDIEIDTDLAPKARLEVKTVSGSVELRVPASVGADFEIESFSGRIRNQFGQQARRSSKYGPGYELLFARGDGSARVFIKTLSGSVRLLEK
ncbi:MAG: DUF4097 family beta strand repeat protein [Thermoanaerobaculaceae bacterium]|nr:DUF4097 family beta strand repeat protein [Thermoanaerobaculaceae bacterium]MDI9621015.1 DUF4097 family beta strand repeat-containing protein [Acidobacteriota bacterium]NLH12672.1 DUF4097 family beta strand repeat protein [Holophagae bacterium]HPW55870.1 DUF4097 family beta strand repeat-containing protein [Thermoanaerobaculaceae bacterium]